MYTDNVCLDSQKPETCINNFGFFLIKNQSGLDGLEGILGFAPITGEKTGPSYIKNLHEQGHVESKIVSFQLNYENSQYDSIVTIGGHDKEAYTGETMEHDLV